jgi:3-dehydroquinate synthase class II
MFKSIDTSQNGGFDAITFSNNKKDKVKELGKITISNDMSISNVLLVESLDFNLLSVAQLCDLDFKCIFGSDDVEVISVDGSNLIFKGFRLQ